MSGISSSFQTACVLEVMGEQVAFTRLDIYDLSTISEIIKAKRKDIARRNAKETNLTNQEMFNVLSEIDVRDITVSEIIDYCMTPSGAVDIVSTSLKKKNMSPEAIKDTIVGLSSADLVVLSQQLVVYNPKKADAEADSKNAVKEVSTPTVVTSVDSTTSTKTEKMVNGIAIPGTYGN